MLIVNTGTRHEARASYEQRHVLKDCGWRWDGEARTWWTDNTACVAALRRTGINLEIHQDTPPLVPVIDRDHPSRALDGPLDLPCPPDRSYLPFQRGGIAYACKVFGITPP